MATDNRFGFGHKGLTYDAPKDCRAYYVGTMHGSIGYVLSNRSESWRQTSTGVRYSLRGKPKHWEAYLFGDERVGYRYSTRLAAAIALHAAAIERERKAEAGR